MAAHTKPKGVVPRLHLASLQEVADLTMQSTDLYDDNGIVRMVLSGWPCSGTLLHTVMPNLKEMES